MGTSPAHSLTQGCRDPRYLGGRVQFEGWLLSHAAEVGPDLLFVTLVIRVIQVIVVSWWQGQMRIQPCECVWCVCVSVCVVCVCGVCLCVCDVCLWCVSMWCVCVVCLCVCLCDVCLWCVWGGCVCADLPITLSPAGSLEHFKTRIPFNQGGTKCINP